MELLAFRHIPQSNYLPSWKQCKRRAGLDTIDAVFLVYSLLVAVSIVAASLSVHANKQVYGHVELGSWILGICALLFLPIAAFLIHYRYFTYFPRGLSNAVKDPLGCEPPSPWAFGDQILAVAILAFEISAWNFLTAQLVTKPG